ncbi:uncharacterized protein LOC110225325 [Arabidopsis lyrata subsp. lyrata]|uniref:uncharacterized protein LOC110225325 n=1 Tax=Arabidopsis lyrata subsp. lyrata TaxID=81972 RepID=UPI000A29DCD3|nr:uncharacterized protein LOC110225325 [Arabidopsis lyrata subsp. lyrata]|eukprot:XP_020870431.1 uncharacterized protein LOC110225325 [Arabidopsis lyrata subsp. lyrata]
MVWRLASIPPLRNIRFTPVFEENLSNLMNLLTNQTIQDDQKLMPYWFLWRIWKARNHFVFNKGRESASKTVLKAQAETTQWIIATTPHKRRDTMPSHNTSPPPSLRCWTAPSFPYIKCNFDAGFDIHTQQATAGWIIRDHHGLSKHWGSLQLGYAASPLEAETKALIAAMQQTWVRGYKTISFEGDCEILIRTINESSRIGTLTNLLQDIKFWARKFQRTRFIFTKREGNMAAHNLAKFGCLTSVFYSDSVTQPLWL